MGPDVVELDNDVDVEATAVVDDTDEVVGTLLEKEGADVTPVEGLLQINV